MQGALFQLQQVGSFISPLNVTTRHAKGVPTSGASQPSTEKFGFKLVESGECIDEIVHEILNIDVDAINCLETECPKISGEISVQNQQKLKTLFFEEYVIPERPEKPQVETQMKITLKEHKPFQFRPRRLFYSEKNDFKNILDRLIKSNQANLNMRLLSFW